MRDKLAARGELMAEVVTMQGTSRETLRLSGSPYSVSLVRTALFNAAVSWSPINLDCATRPHLPMLSPALLPATVELQGRRRRRPSGLPPRVDLDRVSGENDEWSAGESFPCVF